MDREWPFISPPKVTTWRKTFTLPWRRLALPGCLTTWADEFSTATAACASCLCPNGQVLQKRYMAKNLLPHHGWRRKWMKKFVRHFLESANLRVHYTDSLSEGVYQYSEIWVLWVNLRSWFFAIDGKISLGSGINEGAALNVPEDREPTSLWSTRCRGSKVDEIPSSEPTLTPKQTLWWRLKISQLSR